MTSDETRQLGRAKNAVLAYFENRLSIPKIYIDAEWDGHRVDVLAINRDGVGDVHCVLLFALDTAGGVGEFASKLSGFMNPMLDRLEKINAQYKYVGAVLLGENETSGLPGIPHEISERSFSPDGLGRVGFLSIHSPFADGNPQVEVLFKPERFRAKIAKLADEYVQQHEADWEIRA